MFFDRVMGGQTSTWSQYARRRTKNQAPSAIARLAHPHDQLCKNLLQEFSHELLRIVAPEAADELHEDSQFLNQELFPEVGNDSMRRLDVFAEHFFKTENSERSILSNTEIEAEYRSDMAQRVQQYQALIFGKHLRAALMVVIFLRGGTPGLAEVVSSVSVANKTVLSMTWYQIGLKMMDADVYVQDENLLYVLLSVHMKRNNMSKAKHRAECLRRIYEAKLTETKQRIAVVFICSYLPLESHEQKEYNQLMAEQQQYTGAKNMELTWEEQLITKGREKGKLEGLKEGLKEGIKEGLEAGVISGRIASLLRILVRRNIGLAETQKEKIQNCRDVSLLDQWIDRALDIQHADELWA